MEKKTNARSKLESDEVTPAIKKVCHAISVAAKANNNFDFTNALKKFTTENFFISECKTITLIICNY